MLFVIGLGSGQVVLYRIVYMALFLIFVLTFQVRLQKISSWSFTQSIFFLPALLQNLENHDVWFLVDGDCLLYAGACDDLHLPIWQFPAVLVQLHWNSRRAVRFFCILTSCFIVQIIFRQHDIGLEIYDTGSLFVRLLTPTFFVVITVIQLHYFHKDFLAISDIRYRFVPDLKNDFRVLIFYWSLEFSLKMIQKVVWTH